jgi:Putative Ig domain
MRSGRHNYYYVFTDRMHDASRSLILAWVLSLLVACGGGGGGGGSPPPTSAGLSYPSAAQTFVVGTAITAITPTITGTLTSFTISPTLPAGLSLDGSKGTISGTPTAISAATTYTVSASGAGGASATASVSITVNDVPPSAVTYGTSSYSYTANLPASTLNPKSSGGAVVSWSINPALPAGLNLNATNGSISGTPTAASASTSYVVTAQNSGGQSTVTLTIAVSAAPLIHLGHQANVNVVRVTATNVLSADTEGNWILWDYTGASIVTYGAYGCPENTYPCSLLSPAIDLAGTTAAIVTPTGIEVHSTSDGHTLGTIATSSVSWWKLATDGSYIAAGSTKGVSAWSPSGQLLFTNPGDYSQAVAFATPAQLLIGAGAAGANVIETIAVPSGASTTGPQFNGTFASWFTDGGRFITVAGTTVLVYSSAGVQQGTFTGVNAIEMAGQGNWLWISSSGTGVSVLNIYPATGTNPAPAATYTFSATASPEPTASGLTIGVQDASAGSVSVIDLSGATPVRTDYPGRPGLQLVTGGPGAPYAAVSASQWVFGSGTGVVVDGTTLASTPRYFGLGAAQSISGGSGHFAIATALGNILYFNASTLAQEGQIAFTAVHLQSSTDGTVLAAGFPGVSPVRIYSLPAGNLLYSWTTAPQDFDLSGSGTVLGQVFYNIGSGGTPGQLTQEAAPATGGSSIFSANISLTSAASLSDDTPPLRISPDGTLIAYSQTGSPTGSLAPYVSGSIGTNLLLNGTLVTAFSGLTVGWLDNSRLLVNNYMSDSPGSAYSGCALFGANGMATGGACALQFEVQRFQPVTSDGIYVPLTDQILSVSTSNVVWKSADPFIHTGLSLGAVAGANVIFISGIDVLAQTFN